MYLYRVYVSWGGDSQSKVDSRKGGALHGTVVILKSGSLAPGLGKKIPGHPGGRNLPYLQTSLCICPTGFPITTAQRNLGQGWAPSLSDLSCFLSHLGLFQDSSSIHGDLRLGTVTS